MRALLVAFVLVGCGGPYVEVSTGFGWRWRSEPTVGPSTSDLSQSLDQALERWGYGIRVPTCVDADVCVTLGTANHAGRRGPRGRCVAQVHRPDNWRLIAHEIGHCYGIPHSLDPDSVMFWYVTAEQDVTAADRAAVRP